MTARPRPARLTIAERRRRDAALAIAHLRAATPSLAGVIDRVGPFKPAITRDPFCALAGSITHQQVSMLAAATIFNRLRDCCPGRRLTPEAVLAIRPQALRNAGLSRQKASYIHNLAEAFASGTLSSRKLRRMSDAEVIAATTAIKGVGRWTAEMLLIFSLERPDVWPVDDLGLRKGVQLFRDLAEMPTQREVEALGESWRPYRTTACWYLWASLKGPREPSITPRSSKFRVES